MKRIVLVLLAILLITTFTCGCGKENNESISNESISNVESEASSNTESSSDVVDEAVDSKPDYSAFVGNYQDIVSQRAVAQITENEDMESCHIVVYRGSSAFETVQWTMNGKWANEKLSYTDCKKEIISTGYDGTVTTTTAYENGKGYFTFNGENGNLSWIGAEDENCRECVFEKYTDLLD